MIQKSLQSILFLLLALAMTAQGCKKQDGSRNPLFLLLLSGLKDADTNAPAVESTSPNNSDFGVAVSANITVRFNEDMAASTVNNTTIEVTDGVTPVNGVVTCDNRTATFDPAGDLAGLTTYTVTVHREAADRAGNMMDADYSFIFTTVSEGTVANPDFSPIGGTYGGGQTVTIACATAGATIYYTTDGYEPSTSGTEYSGPFTVSQNTQVRAMAVRPGMNDSGTATADYYIRLAAPVISPASGTYNTDQQVTITVSDGAVIHYTTSGDEPTASSPEYSGPIAVAGNGTGMTIRAIAVMTGMTASAVAEQAYSIDYGKVAAPSFNPAPSSAPFGTAQEVTITSGTAGSKIYYTIDGNTPTSSSIPYEVPVRIGVNTTLRAIAYKTGMVDSEVAGGAYLIRTAAPLMDPAPGTYSTGQRVTLSADAGATIHFTTNGDDPTADSDVYSTAISVAGIGNSMTIRAIAVKAGMTISTISSGAYYINTEQAAEPAFNLPAGTYTGPQGVTISCTTAGVTIIYTTDGSDPSRVNGTAYSGTVTVDRNMRLKAMAFRDGLLDSGVSSAAYLIRVLAPTFDPAPSTYSTSQFVTLSAETGAVIYYTTDGTDPTTSSVPYSSPIHVTGDGTNMTIRAFAFIAGLNPSSVASAEYRIDLTKIAAPTFEPVSGTYTGSQSVVISCTTDGATIMYTVNGDDPRTDGIRYTGALTISENTTIRAYARMSEMDDSDTVSSAYHIRVLQPEFTPAAGTHSENVDVAITCRTPSATIYYTTNGDPPTISSSTYDGPIAVHGHGATMTIRAIAVHGGLENSIETSGIFIIDYSLIPARWDQGNWDIHRWNP